MDATVALNSSRCIQEAAHFGYTTYVNICSGISTNVAWGGVDWCGFAFIGLLAVLLLAGVIALIGLVIGAVMDY